MMLTTSHKLQGLCKNMNDYTYIYQQTKKAQMKSYRQLLNPGRLNSKTTYYKNYNNQMVLPMNSNKSLNITAKSSPNTGKKKKPKQDQRKHSLILLRMVRIFWERGCAKCEHLGARS